VQDTFDDNQRPSACNVHAASGPIRGGFAVLAGDGSRRDGMNDGIKHGDLVQKAGAWLKKRYPIVFTEMVTWASQVPDVIAFNSSVSALVECKVSRSDFKKDFKKRHNIDPTQSVGQLRWYFVPSGLVSKDELPVNWGLLELRDDKIYETIKPNKQHANIDSERIILVSAIRRSK
jgi:hypothetical protein